MFARIQRSNEGGIYAHRAKREEARQTHFKSQTENSKTLELRGWTNPMTPGFAKVAFSHKECGSPRGKMAFSHKRCMIGGGKAAFRIRKPPSQFFYPCYLCENATLPRRLRETALQRHQRTRQELAARN
jgi:hypothetical protein